jgi:hypothetical protein
MNKKKPLIAKRSFPTLDDAYGYVNDLTATGTACPGLIISVTADTDAKKNGIYWIESIGVKDAEGKLVSGTLVKAGGTETETADNYTAAVALSNNLTVGQLIRVTNEEEVDASGDSEDSDVTKITYKSGFYIVNAPGSISALDTSTGASDEIGALSNRVATLEGNRVLTSEYEAYKSETATTLDGKVDSDAFDTYKTETETALNTYKGEVSTALDKKATVDALSTLEGKVDTDIKKLEDLVADYSGTLTEVDNRINAVEDFVEEHISHEPIDEGDIAGLFSDNTGSEPEA